MLKHVFGDRPNPLMAVMLNNFGGLLTELEELQRAQKMFQDALAMRQQLLPSSHPDIAMSLSNLALVQCAVGELLDAASKYETAQQSLFRFSLDFLPLLSGADRARYVTSIQNIGYALVRLSLVSEGANASTGFAGLLRGKGLLSQAARAEMAAKHELSDAQNESRATIVSLLNEETALRSELSAMANPLRPDMTPVQALGMRSASRKLDALDRQLRSVSPGYARRAQLRDIQTDDVAALLRPGEVLVEYTLCNMLEHVGDEGSQVKYKNSKKNHYVVFVVQPDIASADGYTVRVVHLGLRSLIEGAVDTFREHVEIHRGGDRNPTFSVFDEDGVATSLGTLRELIWDPIKRVIGTQPLTRIYVSMDALLHEIPFGALAKQGPDGKWTYLVEDGPNSVGPEIVYLMSSRELATYALEPLENVADGSTNATIIVSDPDFDASSEQIVAETESQTATRAQQEQGPSHHVLTRIDDGFDVLASSLGVDRARRIFPNDTKANTFVSAIRNAAMLGNLQVPTPLTRAGASEQAWAEIHRPRLLVVATHGLYLPPIGQLEIDPMFRSVLLLAGANASREHSTAPDPQTLKPNESTKEVLHAWDGVLSVVVRLRRTVALDH